MLYRDYDQAGLDAQYNMRERVPDFAQFVARWGDESAAVRHRPGARLDLAYGALPAERLDLFPCGRPGAPLHVFIHGGYWQAMDKEHFAFVANGLHPHGFDVAVLEYTLAPAMTVAGIVAQCRAAVTWLWAHAGEHGYDADNITVSGHSAGGHLTAMLLLTDWPGHARGLPADLVKGGLAISGLYDLEPIRLSYLNQALGLDAAAARAASPLHGLDSAAPPPLLVAVGGDESEEFLRQQAVFIDAWQAQGFVGAALAMPGSNHFSIVDALGRADTSLATGVRRLADGAAA